MNVVIDTNIIISALLTPDGRAFRFLADAMDGKHTVLVSEEIFREYEEVLRRPVFGFDQSEIDFILNWFQSDAVWIEVSPSKTDLPDEDDRPFWDVAKACNARLVTGNTKHYPVDEIITTLAEIT
ncbi:MAG: putative toxin-antitoxin system toxin component, PIN family [Lachnospiraceae bacterium]|nr:putative toxin-antitoxin system toxin component, PIN family [Lachnospiraceae bacterium]